MSLGLTKPGASATLRHPKTGAILAPLGYTKTGKPIMPVLGASSDDEDDPRYVGGGSSEGSSSRSREEDDDEDDDQEDDSEEEKSTKKSAKSKKDEDDDEDEDEPKTRPERQAARYRTQRNQLQRQLDELKQQMRQRDDEGKPADELLKRDLTEAQEQVTSLSARVGSLARENAFLRSNEIIWHDPADVLKLIDFDEIDVDEDGNVDARQLRRALRDLAKRKPHLVKKSSARGQDNDDEEDEQGSKSSASTMNGSRRGAQKKGSDRASLAKRFPVLNR